MTLNKVMLIGNVGKDPEPRHLGNGTMVVSITVATSERIKDRNGEVREQTEWHNVVCWSNLAEIVEKYVRKGTQVYVEGKLRSRSWEDQNGQKRYVTEIVADNLRLLGRRTEQPTNGTMPVGNGGGAFPSSGQMPVGNGGGAFASSGAMPVGNGGGAFASSGAMPVNNAGVTFATESVVPANNAIPVDHAIPVNGDDLPF